MPTFSDGVAPRPSRQLQHYGSSSNDITVPKQYISRLRPVWSESSLCAQWVAKDPTVFFFLLFFFHADSEDSDHFVMIRIICCILTTAASSSFIFQIRSLRYTSVFWYLRLLSVCLPRLELELLEVHLLLTFLNALYMTFYLHKII